MLIKVWPAEKFVDVKLFNFGNRLRAFMQRAYLNMAETVSSPTAASVCRGSFVPCPWQMVCTRVSQVAADTEDKWNTTRNLPW